MGSCWVQRLLYLTLLTASLTDCKKAPVRIIGELSEHGSYEEDVDCGHRRTGTSRWRIVGGSPASKGSFPWQVSIQQDDEHVCGATVINKLWLLTAAHCFTDHPVLEDYTVVVGDTMLDRVEDREHRYGIQTVFVHSGYREKSKHIWYDIALVKLAEPLEYNNYVQPVCLNRQIGRFDHSDQCVMTGWGLTKGRADWHHLQQLYSRVVSQKECNKDWNGDIGMGNICVGHGDKGVCDGDSGGPFQCRDTDGRFYQVGITSFATENCQDYGYPSVFTRVAKYAQWIDQVMDEY